LRMSCQAAIPLGVHAAETILHRLDGSPPLPVLPKFAGRCISVGRRQGVFQRTTRADEATGMFIAGRAGAFVKERVCSSTTEWAVTPRRSPFYSWT
ncbi:oxidoreductase, partial [Rhodococcus erythropolis]|nr:oxidoreductase [Rhodococcus erythropolis]